MVDKISVYIPENKEWGVECATENEMQAEEEHWRFYTGTTGIPNQYQLLVLPNNKLISWGQFEETTRKDELGEHYITVYPFGNGIITKGQEVCQILVAYCQIVVEYLILIERGSKVRIIPMARDSKKTLRHRKL